MNNLPKCMEKLDMALYEIVEDALMPIQRTSFGALGTRERSDLQRYVRDHIEAVAPDTLVLAEEFGDWHDCRRRIDLLLLDKNANLVICELKRTEDGGHLELQAIRYAAMVSTMTFRQAVDAHEAYLRNRLRDEDAEENILEFLGWSEPDDDQFANEVRIVLASQDFSKEITSSVLWLNAHGLDITCVRMLPHTYAGRPILDIQQVVPLPEALEYQVQLRQKEQIARASREGRGDRSVTQDRNLRFWTGLLEKSKASHSLHESISPSTQNWIAATISRVYFAYVLAHDKARVELYMQGVSAEENKRIFEYLLEHKEVIEEVFGDELDWQALEGKRACRIACHIDAGSPRDESTWEELQSEMVAHMIRLETATMEHVLAASQRK